MTGATTPDAPGVRRRDAIRNDLLAALPAWITARVVTLGALALGHLLVGYVHPGRPVVRTRLHQGLLSWDARWYERIASRGYGALRQESLRFFPLWPLIGRALSPLAGGHVGPVLLVAANALALVMGALVHRLTLRETDDPDLARRATWLAALMPPFFVMVMGYSEPLAISLSVAMFLALRRRRWGWAAAAGFVAGLARPSAVLLAVPAAIEGLRGLRGATVRDRLLRLLPVITPVAGLGAFLLWVGVRFGDPLLPVRVQSSHDLRGPLANPLATLFHATARVLEGHADKNAAHLPWVAVVVALTVVACRRWPASYGAFAAATLVVATSTTFLGSFERYAFGAFPVVLALASVTTGRWAERMTLAVSAAAMAGYALLAFVSAYVP